MIKKETVSNVDMIRRRAAETHELIVDEYEPKSWYKMLRWRHGYKGGD